VSLSRLLIPSLFTILIDLFLHLLNIQYSFLPSSPMLMVLPALQATIAVYLYIRLSGAENITGKESLAFGLLMTAIHRILTWAIFTPIWLYTFQSILINLAIEFAMYSAGALFCAYILPQLGLAPGKVPVYLPYETTAPSRHRRLALAFIAIILVAGIIIFPTSHIRTYSNFLNSFTFGAKQSNQLPANLTGGQTSRNSISLPTPPTLFESMLFSTAVDIQSTDNVTIAVTIQEQNITQGQISPVPLTHVLYNATAKIHKSTFQLPIARKFVFVTIEVTAMNPGPQFLANGTIPVPAYLNGSVNIYVDYQLEEWTQWWKP